MEKITANGTEYMCQTVTTSTNQVSFKMQGQEIATVASDFKGVTELTVSPEEGAAYGFYEHLDFESAKVFADGTIEVVMHIPDAVELRLQQLETTQLEQDTVIADMMFGGETA